MCDEKRDSITTYKMCCTCQCFKLKGLRHDTAARELLHLLDAADRAGVIHVHFFPTPGKMINLFCALWHVVGKRRLVFVAEVSLIPD